MTKPNPAPIVESPSELPLHIRTFAEEIPKGKKEPKKRRNNGGGTQCEPPGPNGLTLIFDTETTTDAAQRFKIAFYQLRNRDKIDPAGGDGLDEERVVFDEQALSPRERRIINAYAERRRLGTPMPLSEFRSEVLVRRGIACGALIVTFNGPFDFGRIAIDAKTAHATEWRRKMAGGFSLKFTENPFVPKIQIKALNPRAALTELTAPSKQSTPRSHRKKRQSSATNRGYFVDVKTLAAALTSRSHSLESLTKALDSPTKKAESKHHGEELTFAYLDYARSDVQATWECYQRLSAKYATYNLDTPIWEIMSEAGIGKAMLKTMGVRPWMEIQPGGIDKGQVSLIMSTYIGGRTEVHLRRQLARVLHTDFISNYAMVCALQNLWRFVIGQGFTKRLATAEIQAFVDQATPEIFQRQEAWPRLTAIVRVQPAYDLLPVRAPYNGERNATIGLNFLTYKGRLYVTLADCLVAKFLSGKAPTIEEAIVFEPGPPQSGLRPVSICGRRTLDPYKEDPYRALVRMRDHENKNKAGRSEAEQAEIEEVRQALKITVLSMAYGIFVQQNVTPVPRGVPMRVYRPDGSSFVKKVKKVETPGPYFHPLLATFITGAARLMLALAEHGVIALGLDWAFCDTDSIAIAQPEGMDEDEFLRRARLVVEWFRPLNPFGTNGSILKIEDINHRHGTNVLEPLYCWAISSKKYALFNKTADGKPVIRKCSAHGLGHLLAPYLDVDAPAHIPPPLKEISSGKEQIRCWQHDAWYAIIEAALADPSEQVRFDYHPALQEPSVCRYAATSPDLRAWFDHWNKDKEYADQVKPFGFLFTLHPSPFDRLRGDVDDPVEGAEPRKEMHPVAPFDRDLKVAVSKAFDRVTGAPIEPTRLQTYEEVLIGYPNRAETKFLNGGAYDKGPTERRHVVTTTIHLIGKESDRWEEEYFLGLGGDMPIEYGSDPLLVEAVFAHLRRAIEEFGKAKVSKATGVDRRTLAKVARGEQATTPVAHHTIAEALAKLWKDRSAKRAAAEKKIAKLAAIAKREGGIRPAARAVGIDPSNLLKVLRKPFSREGINSTGNQ